MSQDILSQIILKGVKVSSNSNKKSLAQRTHWRRLKELLSFLSKIEKVQLSDYNSNNICCYSCLGDELTGVNVKFQTVGGMSCWVSDNSYDVYEVPSYTNTTKMCGDFLFLAHNTSFDYWLFGEMTYRISTAKTASNKVLYETAYYVPYGTYTVFDEYELLTVKKTVVGKHVTYGGHYGDKKFSFDHLDRRRRAYGSSAKKETQKILGRYEKKSSNSKNPVKIFNKNKKRHK